MPLFTNSDAMYYPIKWILNERGESRPVCMQGHNGPCALLALANALLITSEAKIEPGTVRIAEDSLMSLLAEYVSSRKPSEDVNREREAMREFAVNDFLDLLPSLNRGMDVNIRFNSPLSFEFTRELSVFDVFPTIRIVHGWLVDPQDVRLSVALGNLTYNQLLDQLVQTSDFHEQDTSNPVPSAPPPEAFDDVRAFMGEAFSQLYADEAPQPSPQPEILLRESPETETIREIRPLIIEFLENNRTQLTIYGLHVLLDTLREGETAILFRNSHFYVIRKHNGELYTLVTDEGFLNELNTVWEKLSDITGNSVFYNGEFCRIAANGIVLESSGTPGQPQPTSAPTITFPETQLSGQTSAPITTTATSGTTSQTGPSWTPKKFKKNGKNTCIIQ